MCAHVNYLTFKVAVGVIVTWLVYFCVSRINMVPSSASGDRISPRERFLGRKLDYQRDLRVGFGDYVQTYSPNIVKNSRPPMDRQHNWGVHHLDVMTTRMKKITTLTTWRPQQSAWGCPRRRRQ